MNYLIPANKVKENKQLTTEIIVSHLIKGFVLNGEETYRSNIFYELNVKESEELCETAINLAKDLGYSLTFEQHRGCTFSCIKYN